MDWIEALILGLLQGIAEFLPISSSGHLVLGQYLLGLETSSDITFEVFVHFGTVLSIVTVYWQRIIEILKNTFQVLLKPATWSTSYRDNESFKFAMYVLLSMIPTGIIYVLFKDTLEEAFSNPKLVCAMLIVTGILLLLTRMKKNPQGELTASKSLLIGLAQGVAMIPGISRSGSTISTAIYQNVNRQQAADFSFLMSLPVIIGATLLKTLDLFETELVIDWLPIIVGTLVAYLSGIWAIRVVLDFVKKGKLIYFAIYCFIVGTLGLILI